MRHARDQPPNLVAMVNPLEARGTITRGPIPPRAGGGAASDVPLKLARGRAHGRQAGGEAHRLTGGAKR
jgi:hypothetical protein